MRTPAAVLALLTALSAASADDISRNPSVSLGDEKLFLAFVENDGDVLLNEYIRKDESFENWKVLFAVRYVRSARSVDEVVARWKAYITQVSSPGKALKEAKESNASDRRFALAIRPPGDGYLENNHLRFVPGPGGKGVIYYQASVRVDPTSEADIKRGLEKQVVFSKTLESIALQPIEKMPAQPLKATTTTVPTVPPPAGKP